MFAEVPRHRRARGGVWAVCAQHLPFFLSFCNSPTTASPALYSQAPRARLEGGAAGASCSKPPPPSPSPSLSLSRPHHRRPALSATKTRQRGARRRRATQREALEPSRREGGQAEGATTYRYVCEHIRTLSRANLYFPVFTVPSSPHILFPPHPGDRARRPENPLREQRLSRMSQGRLPSQRAPVVSRKHQWRCSSVLLVHLPFTFFLA